MAAPSFYNSVVGRWCLTTVSPPVAAEQIHGQITTLKYSSTRHSTAGCGGGRGSSGFLRGGRQTLRGRGTRVAAFKRLLKSGRALHTTSYVLVETAALLQHGIGLAAARDFFDGVVPLLTVGWVEADLHRKGVERLLRENRRQLSLVDCVSLECMRLLDVREALALDSHFAEAGYRLVPGLRQSNHSEHASRSGETGSFSLEFRTISGLDVPRSLPRFQWALTPDERKILLL